MDWSAKIGMHIETDEPILVSGALITFAQKLCR